MPGAQPLPRKYLSTLRDATETLKNMANRITWTLETLDERDKQSNLQVRTVLQAFQTTCYSVALSLSEIDIAENCDTCPLAPPQTSAELHLSILSHKIRSLANETRLIASASKPGDWSSDHPQ